jgi:hypothetical protein
MGSSRLLNTILLSSALMLSFAGGMVTGSPPRLSEAFNQAASAGQLPQKQAVKACFDAQAGINTQIMTARGSNKLAPQQAVDFHCAQADVNTVPAKATFAPAP